MSFKLNKSGAKFNDAFREEVKAICARYDRKGYSQTKIVEILRTKHDIELSQSTVSLYLRDIRDEWVRMQQIEHKHSVARKIAQYEKVREEAWEAYERSTKNGKKIVEQFVATQPNITAEKCKGKQSGYYESTRLISMVRTLEGRLPENVYLMTIMKTLEAERDLLGLDKQSDVPTNQVNIAVGVDVKAMLDAAKGDVESLNQVEDKPIQLNGQAYLGNGNGHDHK